MIIAPIWYILISVKSNMPAAHVSCKYLTSTIKRAHGTFVCIMSGLGNRLQDYDLHSQWKTDGIDCLPTCLWRVSIGNATALAGEILKALIPLGDGRVFVLRLYTPSPSDTQCTKYYAHPPRHGNAGHFAARSFLLFHNSAYSVIRRFTASSDPLYIRSSFRSFSVNAPDSGFAIFSPTSAPSR